MHQVSDTCCIYKSDSVEHWGMPSVCNIPGPFSSGDPSLGGAGCTNATNLSPNQLTLCGSLFTAGMGGTAPALSPIPLAALGLALAGVGLWGTRTRVTP